MGVIKPPWKDSLFDQCPFNYCDHFGDKEKLSLICIICRDTKDEFCEDFQQYYDQLTEPTDDFTKVMEVVKADTSKIREQHVRYGRFEDLGWGNKLFEITLKYGAQARVMAEKLKVVPATVDDDLVRKAVDSFLHSESYVSAKTRRAITSLQREMADQLGPYDSKISALLACVALERNAKAAVKLDKQPQLYYLGSITLSFANLSLDLADVLHKTFFPKNDLTYIEFGCDSYNEAFE